MRGKVPYTLSTQILHCRGVIVSDEIKTKKCNECGKIKPISEFNKKKHGKYGVRGRCKICNSEIALEYYHDNKDRLNKMRRDNYGGKKEYHRERRENNREYFVEYRKNNKERFSELGKKYRKNNKDKIRSHIKHKLKNNPEFKLRMTLSRRILRGIKEQYSEKAYSTIELLGCTIQEAREHLEKQFKKGMTWENHGQFGWHIDHRVPCSNFDLTDPEHQKACFHFTNLQPIWWRDNLEKADKNLYLL